jgi:1-acyl-sn-glycerol-3-phosphate acyltransferase
MAALSVRARRLLYALLAFGPLEPLARRLSLLVSQGISPRILGVRHVPRSGPLVVASGHASGNDLALLSAAVPRRLEILFDEDPFRAPLTRLATWLRGAHPVHLTALGGDERNRETLERAAEAVRTGRALAIFPQGRTPEVGGGVARIAALAAAPVLPVLLYVVRTPRARPRVLLIIRRPLKPPAADARARRRFRSRFRRRLRASGSLRTEGDLADVLAVAQDDGEVWRDPRRVMRLTGRIGRLPDETLRMLARRARRVLRGTRRLICSVGDLRRPPGPSHALGYLLLIPPALLGLALCAPPLLLLRLFSRSDGSSVARRASRIGVGVLLAGPWGVFLALAGLIVLGPWGLLAPPVALAGLIAYGLARALHHRMRCVLLVRLHGGRARRALDEFDDALDKSSAASRSTGV